MWKCHSRANGRVSISSCGSMPAVGVPVTLRILSAPEPREHSPRSWIASITATASSRLDFADLQIGARRHMRVAAAIALGEIGDAGELRRLENAVRDSQPAHIRVLVRRDVEQTEKTPAEIVRRLRIFALGGVIFQPLVGVERMLLALELLLIGEFLAGGDDAVLRLEPGGVRPDRLGRRRGAAARRRRAGDAFRRLGDLHAGDKTFQVAFLFRVEIAGLFGGSGLEVSLAHSAGTCVGAASGAGAAARGLWVR